MIAPSQAVKHYSSARRRFLQQSIEDFLKREFPKIFGPVIRRRLSEELISLIQQQLPPKEFLRPGQCLWNAVSIKTRPDSPNVQFIPVVLTLIDPADIEDLTVGTAIKEIAGRAIARLTQEAYQQGALLSMRDIALLTWRDDTKRQCSSQSLGNGP